MLVYGPICNGLKVIVARLSGLVRGLRRSDSHGNGVLYGGEGGIKRVRECCGWH